MNEKDSDRVLKHLTEQGFDEGQIRAYSHLVDHAAVHVRELVMAHECLSQAPRDILATGLMSVGAELLVNATIKAGGDTAATKAAWLDNCGMAFDQWMRGQVS